MKNSWVGCLTSIHTVELIKWCKDITIESKVVKFQLDTSAKCNVLPYRVIEDLEIKCNINALTPMSDQDRISPYNIK